MFNKWPVQKIYYIKSSTFRRTLELRVWWWEKECEEFGFDYRLTWGFYWFDEEHNCNLIWLRDYNLNTLVHELVHCVEWMCEQVGLEFRWEPAAFMYEELFTKIMIQCGNKFNVDADTKHFFSS
jgi:hypothetical protein